MFTENTDVLSNKCTEAGIVRFLRVTTHKNVYRITYFQKRLNGFPVKSVQISYFESVLLAHLHVVGVILQTPCPMVNLEPACGAHKEVRQALSRNRPLGQEPQDGRRQISGRREWLWIRQNLRRLQPQLL
jgi:hypothetical protein